MRRVAVGLFITLMTGAIGAGAKEPLGFRPPSASIFEALGAEAVACPDSRTREFEDHVVVDCATTGESFKTIRKLWRKAVRRGSLAKLVRWDEAPWRKGSGTARVMYALHGGTPLEIQFDEISGAITVNWPDSYPGCHAGYDVTWWTKTTDVLPPTAREQVHPDFPEQARVQRTAGAVMGSFVLDRSGRIVDVCVVGVYPANVGFEEASVEAQMGTRYEPATRDGEPVGVAATFSHTYWLPPEGAHVSPLLKNYFDGVRHAPGSGR